MAFLRLAILALLTGYVACAASLPAQAQTVARKAVYLPYSEAQPIISALAEILPPELKGLSNEALAAKWAGWLAQRDRAIRARLDQGDEDSLVNFLLFGATYTKQPRFSPKQISDIEGQTAGAEVSAKLAAILAGRLRDLALGLNKPGTNERLLFTRQWLANKGFRFATEPERAKLKEYLNASVQRVLREQDAWRSIE